MKAEDVARRLMDIVKAGIYNSNQEQLMLNLSAELGDIKLGCKHDSGTYADSGDNFFCNSCGSPVQQPVGDGTTVAVPV